ncbi:hypothetical protein LCGC14_2465960, partial [marine sediment metagenome]
MKGKGYTPIDREWMTRALLLAEQAGAADEVPVGAVLVKDGVAIGVAQTGISGDIIYNSISPRIGHDGTGGDFNGTIDDVIIFNRSLSAEEIAGLYANQTSGYLQINYTSLSDGAHTFKAYTQDMAGNVNSTGTRSVATDTTSPQISITYPPNNTNTSDTGINVNYTRGSDVVNCWYSNDTYSTNTSLNCGTNIT